MESSDEYVIHAVAFQNGANWVAQCLEHDIATQATNLDSLLYELERIVVAHLIVAERENLGAFDDIPKAPQRFWDLYRRSRSRVHTISSGEIPAPYPQRKPTFELAFASAA